jgi:hypothetical protein
MSNRLTSSDASRARRFLPPFVALLLAAVVVCSLAVSHLAKFASTTTTLDERSCPCLEQATELASVKQALSRAQSDIESRVVRSATVSKELEREREQRLAEKALAADQRLAEKALAADQLTKLMHDKLRFVFDLDRRRLADFIAGNKAELAAEVERRSVAQRGIVISAGTPHYLLQAYVTGSVIRHHHKSALPVTIAYWGEGGPCGCCAARTGGPAALWCGDDW